MTRDPATIQREHAHATMMLGHLTQQYRAECAKLTPRIEELADELAEAQRATSPEAKLEALVKPLRDAIAKQGEHCAELDAFVESIKPHFEATPGGKIDPMTGAIDGPVVAPKPGQEKSR